MMETGVFRTVHGIEHLVLTQEEWDRMPAESKGIIGPNSPLSWPVGTKTALYYDPKYGTCLAPVIIEG